MLNLPALLSAHAEELKKASLTRMNLTLDTLWFGEMTVHLPGHSFQVRYIIIFLRTGDASKIGG
ncbi:hypothetical protein EBB07_01475 [Paenibacillaceae bacterium]|nr:hypothetical protein EBB07_01475 [Paenibacillaceae bacterium]